MLWRAQALRMQPYMSSILFGLRPVATDEVPWFAVDDGLRLYINFDQVADMDDPRFAGQGLLHECGHVFGKHAERARLAKVSNSEQDAWNVAGDCAINDDLLGAGHADRLEAHGACWLGTRLGQPLHQTVEHYFSVLRPKGLARRPSPPGEGGKPYGGCGSVSGGSPAPCEIGDDDLGGQAAPATPMTVARAVQAAARAIKEHVAAKGRGIVPGGMLELADHYLRPPEVDWRDILPVLKGGASGGRVHWRPPSLVGWFPRLWWAG